MIESKVGITAPNIFPKQKVSYKEKSAEDFLWAKECAEYIRANADFDSDIYKEMDVLYRARVGMLDPSDYKLQSNPFNADAGSKLASAPFTVRQYPLIEPICDLMLSEFGKRPRVMDVVAINDHVDNEFKQAAKIIYSSHLKQRFINELHAQGINIGEQISEEELQAKTEKQLEEVTNTLAQDGQNSIDVLKYELKLIDKWQQGFDDWLTVGRIVTYKDVRNNDVHYKPISPRNYCSSYDRDNSLNGEDAPDGIYRDYWSLNRIIDEFRDELSDEDLDELERIAESDSSFTDTASSVSVPIGGAMTKSAVRERYKNTTLTDREVSVHHVVWKGWKKVGVLTYINPLGQVIQKEVDETYKLDKLNGDLEVSWEWINEVWETWILGESFYVRTRPIVLQRNDISNISLCKLPYNERRRYNRLGEIVSVVKTGLSFQFTYNHLNYAFEKMMNKNKDKVTFFPIGLIPKKPGFTTDGFMYTANNLSFAFYDESVPGAAAAIQGIKVVDMSLAEYAAKTYELLQLVKQEFWDAVGMNRQRYGDVSNSAGKGTTEQAIYRSSMISEESYRQVDEFVESDLNGLLDCSRMAWIDGKKSKIVNSSNQKINVEIASPHFSLTDYLVFVRNGDEEAAKTRTMRDLALSFIQNDTPKSLVVDIVDSDNITNLRRILKEYDDVQRDLIERQQQAAEQTNQIEQEKINRDDETKRYVSDNQKEAIIEAAKIRANASNSNLDLDEDTENLDKEKLEYTKQKDIADRQQKDRHHKDKIMIDNKKIKQQGKNSLKNNK